MTRDDHLQTLRDIETELNKMAEENPALAARVYMLTSRLQFQRAQVADLYDRLQQAIANYEVAWAYSYDQDADPEEDHPDPEDEIL